VCIVSSSCSAADPPQADLKVITAADNKKTVTVNSGQFVELRLESEPSTGYKWYLRPASIDGLKLVRESETRPVESGFGRPVFQVFRFRAEKRTKAVIRLVYIRPWEDAGPNERSYETLLQIR